MTAQGIFTDAIAMADGLCQAWIPPAFPGAVWAICCAPATAAHRYGCIHEHVKDAQSCDLHRPIAGTVGCIDCLNAGHECPMTFQEVPA